MSNERILIVDDEEMVRKLLRRKLSMEGYSCQEAGSAEEALVKLKNGPVELVLLDIRMPGKSGIELLAELKVGYPDTAVIMATAVAGTSIAIRCMKNGAYDYLTKPFNLEEVVLSVARALEKRRLELVNRDYQQHLEQEVAKRTKELRRAVEETKLASLDTVYRLSRAAEYKDEYTGAHIQRMSRYSAAVARKMGLNKERVETILYASPMHDIGKIGIPDRILLKPGRLDPDEWEIMKRHTIIGAKILENSDTEFIKLGEVIALSHHEKWDGSGYPGGLKDSEIPLAGRIAAIADVFDALVSKRPYKKPFLLEKSFDIIKKGSGSHFDPDVLDAFFAVKNEILAIKEKYKDEHVSLLVRMASLVGS